MHGDESRILRERHSTLADALDASRSESTPTSRSMVVQTTTKTTYPTTTGVYYACLPVDVGGVEDEGVSGIVSAGSGYVFVLVLGVNVPATGTKLVADLIGGRWASQYYG